MHSVQCACSLLLEDLDLRVTVLVAPTLGGMGWITELIQRGKGQCLLGKSCHTQGGFYFYRFEYFLAGQRPLSFLSGCPFQCISASGAGPVLGVRDGNRNSPSPCPWKHGVMGVQKVILGFHVIAKHNRNGIHPSSLSMFACLTHQAGLCSELPRERQMSPCPWGLIG